MQRIMVVLELAVLVLWPMIALSPTLPAFAESYANVGSILELGVGARPLALGDAFVGLADDGYALLYNAAGLAVSHQKSVMSSYETLPDAYSYGTITAACGSIGVSVHSFDFGLVQLTDEDGVPLGTRRYGSGALLLGGGLVAWEVPDVGELAIGAVAKVFRVWGLTETGDGRGLSGDLSLLVCPGHRGAESNFLTDYRVGLVAKNLFGTGMVYDSGHEEAFPIGLAAGASAEFVHKVTFVFDSEVGKGMRFGVEVRPVRAFCLRAGLRDDGVLIPTVGCGITLGGFGLDFAMASHPYLSGQYRLTFVVTF